MAVLFMVHGQAFFTEKQTKMVFLLIRSGAIIANARQQVIVIIQNAMAVAVDAILVKVILLVALVADMV